MPAKGYARATDKAPPHLLTQAGGMAQESEAPMQSERSAPSRRRAT